MNEDANLEMSINVYKVLCDVWHYSEGISRDEMKILCNACGIDSRSVIGDDPAPTPEYDGNQDLNVPF